MYNVVLSAFIIAMIAGCGTNNIEDNNDVPMHKYAMGNHGTKFHSYLADVMQSSKHDSVMILFMEWSFGQPSFDLKIEYLNNVKIISFRTKIADTAINTTRQHRPVKTGNWQQCQQNYDSISNQLEYQLAKYEPEYYQSKEGFNIVVCDGYSLEIDKMNFKNMFYEYYEIGNPVKIYPKAMEINLTIARFIEQIIQKEANLDTRILKKVEPIKKDTGTYN